MINLSILDELNREGFGANIDRLRLYLIELKNSFELSCPIEQYERFKKLQSLLSRLDPDQEIVKYVVDTTNSDVQRGQDLSKQKDILKNIGQEIDIVAYIRSDGIQVTVEYEFGTYKQAYTFINYEMIDLTDKLKTVIIDYVDDWKTEDNVTVQGRITIPRKNLKNLSKSGFKNINHALVHFTSQKDYSEVQKYIRFIADEITFQTESKNSISAWEALSLLKINGFEVPQRIKAQGIMDQNLEQAVDKMINYFDNFDKTNEFEYTYTGVQFIQNSQYIKNNYNLYWCVNTRTSDIKDVYRGKIKSISWKPDEDRLLADLKMIELDRNDRETDKNIEYSGVSLRDLDRNEITIGTVVNIHDLKDGTKVLCDKYGNEILRS